MRQAKQKVSATGTVTQPELLTAPQVAVKFGVSVNFIYLHKELPHLRVGKRLLFREDELLAFFKDQSLRQR